VEHYNPKSSLSSMARFRDFLLETRGRSVLTTARIICNKSAYLINRIFRQAPAAGLVHVGWHWAKYPFSLRGKVMWSRALRGWFAPSDESAIECMLHMPAYEPIEWVSPCPGEYFLDGGGYVGWYSIQAGRAIGPTGRVFVLEPDNRNREQLERNLVLNKVENVQIFPLALWSNVGQVSWRHGEEPVWHRVGTGDGATQNSVSIDSLVAELKLIRLDWIKLDIEGAEVEALLGANWTLRNLRPKLFIEVHETDEIVRKILQEAGYVVVRHLYDQPPDRHGWILAHSS
jgi:FkbM family methyltransferase